MVNRLSSIICISSICFFILSATTVFGQIKISGTVFDSSKIYPVPDVKVFSTSGASAITDTLGYYVIEAKKSDSLHFFFNNKYTVKFPVANIQDYTSFDISLHLKTDHKYKILKPVVVYSDTYKRDSIENRITYSKYFKDRESIIQSSYEPGGPAGLNLDALIGAFQFKKNRQRLIMQNRLIEEEQDRYVDYRFSKRTITRVTGLTGDALDLYQKLYRPTYGFVIKSSLIEFYEYLLQSSYTFKKEYQIP